MDSLKIIDEYGGVSELEPDIYEPDSHEFTLSVQGYETTLTLDDAKKVHEWLEKWIEEQTCEG